MPEKSSSSSKTQYEMDTEISWYCLPVTVTIRKCSLVYSKSSIALVAEYYGFSLVIGIRKCGIEFAIRSESRDVQLVEQLVVYSSFADRLLGVARGSASSSSLCPFARLFSRCSSAGGRIQCLSHRSTTEKMRRKSRSAFPFLLRATQQGAHRDLFVETATRGHADFPPAASPLISPVCSNGASQRWKLRSNNEAISSPRRSLLPFRRRSRENRNTGADRKNELLPKERKMVRKYSEYLISRETVELKIDRRRKGEPPSR